MYCSCETIETLSNFAERNEGRSQRGAESRENSPTNPKCSQPEIRTTRVRGKYNVRKCSRVTS